MQPFRQQTAPARVLSAGSQVLPANLLQPGLLSLQGPQVLPGPCSGVGFPRGHSLLGHPPALAWGPPRAAGGYCSTMDLHGLQVEICSTMDLHGLQGTACLTMGCTTGCRGISAPAPGAAAPPPSALALVVCRAVALPHTLAALPRLLLCSRFFPFLKYVIPEVLPPSLMGLALVSGESVLEPAGIGFIGHGGSF